MGVEQAGAVTATATPMMRDRQSLDHHFGFHSLAIRCASAI
jgi:hypothetical protein